MAFSLILFVQFRLSLKDLSGLEISVFQMLGAAQRDTAQIWLVITKYDSMFTKKEQDKVV